MKRPLRPMKTAPRNGSLIVIWIEDSLQPRFGFWQGRGGWVSVSREIDGWWLNGSIGWQPITELADVPGGEG